jgi:hypothetical protein
MTKSCVAPFQVVELVSVSRWEDCVAGYTLQCDPIAGFVLCGELKGH